MLDTGHSDLLLSLVSFFFFPFSAGEGASNKSSVAENGDIRFNRSLSSEHFTYITTRQLSRDTTVDDLGDISRLLDCFALNFS